MSEIRFDRSPALVEIKMPWVRVLLPNLGTNKLYDRVRALKTELKKNNKDHPGINQRKPTLAEFCKYFNLPVEDSAHILNNRYHTRIIIENGPYCNKEGKG